MTAQAPQRPGALSASSSPAVTYKTPYANGCPVTAPYGASIVITSQVQDDTSQHFSINSSRMEPQEQTSNLVINGTPAGSGAAPVWTDIGPSTYPIDKSPVPGTSKFTNANGQFLDAPFTPCAQGSINVTLTQAIRIMIGQITYIVKNNNWTVASSQIGHGSISSGADVNHNF